LTALLGEGDITRAYSIATAPDGRTFGICANLVSDGHFSPWLFSRKPGDEIEFKGPYGAFTPRASSESILVATGTGIAPFRSFLIGKGGLAGKSTLVFGTRHEHGLLYDAEWRELADSRPDFTYYPTLTRPSDDWKGRTGRVQPHVMEVLGDRRDIDIYICGLREMVDELRTQLKALGVDRKRIIYEKYD
jgi:NAD(P)H-flavin reductase